MLHIDKQADGYFKITADSGKIKDIRKNMIYSEAVVEERDVDNFIEVTE